jgi:hypothetical protein
MAYPKHEPSLSREIFKTRKRNDDDDRKLNNDEYIRMRGV